MSQKLYVYFRLVDLCSLKRFEVEPKTLLDTSVDRRNYGILIRGSRNVGKDPLTV